MKTKNKLLAMVEITVVLCSMFLVALPVISAGVTTASEDDYVLDIYGNANEDDTIDMRDVTYTKLVIFGKKPETELADAYYDGEVDVLDVVQIKLIILGRESELTVVDSGDRTVTVKKPVERVITLTSYPAEAIRMFGEKDKIVAVSGSIKEYDVYFPEISELPSVGDYPFDPEAILGFEPDLVIDMVFCVKYAGYADKLPESIAVLGLDFYKPDVFVEELTKLGYVLNSKDSVDEYFSTFHDKYIDLIKARTEELSEDERPKVYVESSFGDYQPYGEGSGHQKYIEIAGGRNIFADMPLLGSTEVDPEEVVIRNPDIIVRILGITKGYDVGYDFDDPSDMIAKREEIMSRPELTEVTAITDEMVYIMSNDFTYGLDYPISIIYEAKWYQPELFEDLDPQAIHQEFIDNFCPGLDYDVYEHGVFVYPPPES